MTTDLNASSVALDPADAAPENAIVASRGRRLLTSPEATVLYALVALVVVFTAINPSAFGAASNVKNVVADASTLVILASVTTFVIITASIDLSIGSVVAFAEVAGIKSMIAVGGGGLTTCLIGLATAIAAGTAWGMINGQLVARLSIPPLITTLATFGIALGAAELLSGGNDLANVPVGLIDHVGVGKLAGIPVIAIIGLATALVAAIALMRTVFGRYTYAVGSDRLAAERAGINVRRHLFLVYTIAGAAYGLVAFLELARFGTTQIGGHDQDALNAVTAVALGGASLFGGVGTVLGTVIGVLIPAVLQNGLVIANVQPYWQQVAVGVALLLAVYADQVRRQRQRRT